MTQSPSIGTTMRTPRYVATVSTSVLAIAVMVTRVVGDLVVSSRSDAFLGALGQAALGSVFLGVFAWLGAYLGARYSAPYQRSDRLVQVLSLTFVVTGVLLSLPVQTHAVRLDMPSTSHVPTGADWSAVLLPLGSLVLLVAIPFVVTRVLALVLVKVRP